MFQTISRPPFEEKRKGAAENSAYGVLYCRQQIAQQEQQPAGRLLKSLLWGALVQCAYHRAKSMSHAAHALMGKPSICSKTRLPPGPGFLSIA
jgi:hypothetical protein